MTATAMTPRTNARNLAAAAVAAAAAELGLTPTLHATGALFNIDERTDNGPLMSGSFSDEHGKTIPVSAFLETVEETSAQYLSLSLGSKGKTHFYGKLFRNGAKGGSPDYSGFLIVLGCDQADQHDADAWEQAPRLQVCGWRRRSASGKARIALTVAPKVVADDELSF